MQARGGMHSTVYLVFIWLNVALLNMSLFWVSGADTVRMEDYPENGEQATDSQ